MIFFKLLEEAFSGIVRIAIGPSVNYKSDKPNLKGLHPNKAKRLKEASVKWKSYNSGASNYSHPYDAATKPSKQNTERIFGQGNSFVVLGRDRTGEQTKKTDKSPNPRDTGYGSMPGNQCWIIDLVAGKQSAFSGVESMKVDGKGTGISTSPNFFNDGARIYIAQKTDVDRNFRLVRGKVGSPRARSAIALKADGVRIIGREGIKLITGEGFGIQSKNSQGGSLGSIKGIDLIAGNWKNPSLQPLVKGDNLVECINDIYVLIEYMGTILHDFATGISDLEADLRSHVHIAPLWGPNSISPDLLFKAPQHEKKHLDLLLNLTFMQGLLTENSLKYCSGIQPDNYINSFYNNTN